MSVYAKLRRFRPPDALGYESCEGADLLINLVVRAIRAVHHDLGRDNRAASLKQQGLRG